MNSASGWEIWVDILSFKVIFKAVKKCYGRTNDQSFCETTALVSNLDPSVLTNVS